MVRAMLRRAINTVSLAVGESPQWVQLLPAGTFSGRDGAGPYHLDDPQAVIDATLAAASGADLPIDYDHQTLWSSKNGQPAVASGWIKQYQARPDGVWGLVEWTRAAAGRLADREYRYLSPVFWHDASGNVIRIEHAALTNVPNLELAAVASRLPIPTLGGEMDPKLLAALAAALGLPADIAAEQLVAHAKNVAARDTATGQILAAMAKSLGLAVTAAPEAVQTAVADILAATNETAQILGVAGPVKPAQLAAHARELFRAKQGQADTADPAKYVPMEQFRAVADRLGALESGLATDKATAAVEAAMAAGKITPKTKEWALAYASKDPAGFVSLMAVAPVIVKPGREVQGQPPAAGGELGEEELAVCSRMGLTPEEYKRHREGV
jgi:phage I-like protein